MPLSSKRLEISETPVKIDLFVEEICPKGIEASKIRQLKIAGVSKITSNIRPKRSEIFLKLIRGFQGLIELRKLAF